jgi:thiol-disulfide isomerase/thioredoxin
MDSEEKTNREMVIVVDRRVLAVGGLVVLALIALIIGVFIGQRSATSRAATAPGSALNQPALVQPVQAVPQVPAELESPADTSLDEPGGLRTGAPAPDFALSSLEGKTVHLSDFKGKPVIINFWATWCPPCRFEMPTLETIYQKYKDKGLVVLGVNTGERVRDAGLPGRVQSYAQQLGIDFPIVLDTTDSVATLYRLRAYPTSYFVDASGSLTDMRRGAFINQADVERYLTKIIAQ